MPDGALPYDVLKISTPRGLCNVTVPIGAKPGTLLVFTPPKATGKAGRS